MADTSLTLSLSATLPEARLAQLTRNLGRDLSRAGIQARTVEASPAPGERGEPVTLGVLALALVTHGVVTAMVECLKTYLTRESALTIKFAGPDGLQIEVTARNVDTAAVREALEATATATATARLG